MYQSFGRTQFHSLQIDHPFYLQTLELFVYQVNITIDSAHVGAHIALYRATNLALAQEPLFWD